MNYADDMLDTIEKIIATAYREAKDNSDRLVVALKNNLAALQQNQEELREAKESPEGVFTVPEAGGEQPEYFENTEDNDDYNFPEGTFDQF